MYELFSGISRWRWLTATTKVFFSQNCLTCKCRPFEVDPAASQYFCERVTSICANIPIIPLTWTATFREISRCQIYLEKWAPLCQISAQWHLQCFSTIYLKIWRLSMQNISRCGLALKTRFFLWRRARSWPVCIFEMLNTIWIERFTPYRPKHYVQHLIKIMTFPKYTHRPLRPWRQATAEKSSS